MTYILYKEIITELEKKLQARGIKLKTGTGVNRILGEDKASGVLLSNGGRLNAGAVILTTGHRPNTDLARKVGISLNEKGFIKVDEYFRTDTPDIFAIGDCTEKKDFITGKTDSTMLGSTACTEARILGRNLFSLRQVKTFQGTIPIFLTAIGETGFGAAGLIEKQAKNEGLDVVTGTAQGIDRHPGTLKRTHRQVVKLIADRETGIILGGEVIGGRSAGELINVIGLAIQNLMSAHSLFAMQLGTHPLLTGSPGGYSIIKAAEAIFGLCEQKSAY